MENLKYKQKGITLIALVITIVVLLILAGISLSMLSGNNGILSQTQNAKNKTEEAADRETIQLAYSSCTMNKLGTDNISVGKLKSELNKNGCEVNRINKNTEQDGEYEVILKSGKKYKLSSDGNVEYIGNEELPEVSNIYIYRATKETAEDTLLFSNCEIEEAEGYTIVKEYTTLSDNNANFKDEEFTGLSKIPWYTENIEKIKYVDILNEIVPKYCDLWFFRCSNLTEIKNIKNLNTINVQNMQGMFYGCHAIEEIDVSGFDTRNVINMYLMFSECWKVKKLDVSGFNTELVTSMQNMFDECESIKELDLSGFNTSNVTNLVQMFRFCKGLQKLDLSSFNTSRVTSFHGLFVCCESLKNVDLSSFDTSNVTNFVAMFNGCSSLENLDLSNFNTSKVTSMTYMFQNCSSLKLLDLSSFNTSNVTNMRYMFKNCTVLEKIYASDWDIAKVGTSDSMFEGCIKLVGAVLYNASNVDASMANTTTGYFTRKQ